MPPNEKVLRPVPTSSGPSRYRSRSGASWSSAAGRFLDQGRPPSSPTAARRSPHVMTTRSWSPASDQMDGARPSPPQPHPRQPRAGANVRPERGFRYQAMQDDLGLTTVRPAGHPSRSCSASGWRRRATTSQPHERVHQQPDRAGIEQVSVQPSAFIPSPTRSRP